MTWSAGGLILDIIGVVLIWAGTSGAGVDGGGYLSLYRPIPQGATGTRFAVWAKLVGWLFLLLGFALQLVGELTTSG
jgi:hypothetical protein